MNGLSRRMQEIRPSATAVVFKRVAELQRGGASLIPFHVGEPDFDTPPHVREAAKRALDAGASRYTTVRGVPELRDAICEDSARRRGTRHRPEEVVVSVGAKHALFNLAQALYDPGDEVLIPSPAWVSYVDQAVLAGATPVRPSCSPEDGFLLTPRALREALTPRTKALVLCSPSNPTGALYSADALQALLAELRHHSCWILVDEIYARLVYDGSRAPSLLEVAPELRDRIAIVDGVSKSYAMTGWRIGWLLAPEPVAAACETVQSQVTTNPTSIAQEAALAALTGDQGCVEAMRATFEQRRGRLLEGLRRACGLRCERPQGAFYAFVDVRSLYGRRWRDGTLQSDLDVTRWLLEEARCAVVPGQAFGTPDHVRFSYALSTDALDEGISRIADAIAALG